ncbi:MAG: hypothetical protein ACO20F_07950 [Robiginitalea sp.]|jgi:hypothetical protein
MATVRLNIAYKSILVGACLLASLWNAKCEGVDYAASTNDAHPTEACYEHTTAVVSSRS